MTTLTFSAVCEDTMCISKPQPAPGQESSVASGLGSRFGWRFVGAQTKGLGVQVLAAL